MSYENTVNWQKDFDSSTIAKFRWSDDEELFIQFKFGLYIYYGVPEKVFNDMCNADSKGIFHAKYIKGSYEYEKIG